MFTILCCPLQPLTADILRNFCIESRNLSTVANYNSFIKLLVGKMSGRGRKRKIPEDYVPAPWITSSEDEGERQQQPQLDPRPEPLVVDPNEVPDQQQQQPQQPQPGQHVPLPDDPEFDFSDDELFEEIGKNIFQYMM